MKYGGNEREKDVGGQAEKRQHCFALSTRWRKYCSPTLLLHLLDY
jgi:hypothetical protein